MRKGGRKVFAKHFARQHQSTSRRHTLWKYAGGKKTQNLTHFESTRGLRGRKYLRNIFINGINPRKEQTSLNHGFVDFKNLTFTTNFAVPSRSHGALFITDTWGVEDCLYDWGCDDIITVRLGVSSIWWSQKQGGLRELPATWVLFPRREEGGQKIAAISPNQVQKIVRCYSFSNHAVSSPPMMAAKMHDDPQVAWEMTPWYWCWWWAPWELPRLLGVSPLPLIPSVAQKGARQRDLIAL